jgi:hypothetical protein
VSIESCGDFVVTEGKAPDLTKLLESEGETPAWAGSAERMLKEMGFASFEERDAWSKAQPATENTEENKKNEGASAAGEPPKPPA